MIRVGRWSTLLGLAIATAGCQERDVASTPDSLALTQAVEAEPSLRPQLQAADSFDEPTSEALADLDRSAAFLASQPRFAFRAIISHDVLQQNGQLLEFGGTRQITVRRPDRMRFDSTDRSGASKSLYFDGQTISVDLPGHRAYVAIERPGTLYAALDHLVDDLGIPAPLHELLSENFGEKIRSRIESGYFVESTVLGDRTCAHWAYRTSEVDVQLWLEEGARPLPCRLVIRYLREPGRPQFQAQIEDWNLTPEASDAIFEFHPPPDADRIPVTKAGRAKERE